MRKIMRRGCRFRMICQGVRYISINCGIVDHGYTVLAVRLFCNRVEVLQVSFISNCCSISILCSSFTTIRTILNARMTQIDISVHNVFVSIGGRYLVLIEQHSLSIAGHRSCIGMIANLV